jgi:hypothetical protein
MNGFSLQRFAMNKSLLVTIGWVLVGAGLSETINSAVPAQVASIGGLSRNTFNVAAGALLIFLNK